MMCAIYGSCSQCMSPSIAISPVALGLASGLPCFCRAKVAFQGPPFPFGHQTL